MSEQRPTGESDPRRLGRRLRLEAARTRPAFSAALQERIIEAAVREHASGMPRRTAAASGLAAVAVAVACVTVAAGLPGRGPRLGSSSPVVVAAEPSLDELPSFAEIADAVAAGTAALAAEAVGLPRWNEFAAAGRFVTISDGEAPWPITP